MKTKRLVVTGVAHAVTLVLLACILVGVPAKLRASYTPCPVSASNGFGSSGMMSCGGDPPPENDWYSNPNY